MQEARGQGQDNYRFTLLPVPNPASSMFLTKETDRLQYTRIAASPNRGCW